MSTYDAPIGYKSIGVVRPAAESLTPPEEDGLDEIYSLEEVLYVSPSAISRFSYAHPGFLWFLLANLFAAPLLAYAGLQIVASHPPVVTRAIIMASGIETMSASDLVAYVKWNHGTAYWFDAVQGDKYTVTNNQDGISTISYIPAGSGSLSPSQANLTVKTYRNLSLYSSQLHPLPSTAGIKAESTNGINVQYDTASPNHMVVTFLNKPEVVAVDYPTAQTPASFMLDAERLVQVK